MVAAKDFTGLSSDSRKVEAGYLFAALSGSKTDGARFLSDAVARGARAVLARPEMADAAAALGVAFIGDENPRLRLAGDACGQADLRAVEHLCLEYPDNRFLISVLSRENQHELCVYARKFANLMPFGCWWFLNNPSIVEEVTRERLEMLGTTFIPQHSDARVLEQVIYKWRNTRRTLAPILTAMYLNLAEDGRPVTRADIRHDVEKLFRSNFERFVGFEHERN